MTLSPARCAMGIDLPAEAPSFIIRVCGFGFHIPRFRFGQARRARRPQIDQALDALQRVFADFDFAPLPSREGNKTWRWRQTHKDLMVEFLTPSFQDEEELRHLDALGVDAQSLHHLNYLIAEPIHAVAVYRSGILLQIPQPERFAIHKLIVADRPDELKDAYEVALNSGPQWGKRMGASLAKMPETRSILTRL